MFFKTALNVVQGTCQKLVRHADPVKMAKCQMIDSHHVLSVDSEMFRQMMAHIACVDQDLTTPTICQSYNALSIVSAIVGNQSPSMVASHAHPTRPASIVKKRK
eukprot:SAG31_NODE_24368_length_483_cov_0.677083_1_plen_103_part_10